jgi:hypothetical protein
MGESEIPEPIPSPQVQRTELREDHPAQGENHDLSVANKHIGRD